MRFQPKQECRLGRIADSLILVQFGSRVDGNGDIEQVLVVILWQELIHLHLVLRQCTSLIRTNHGYCSHRLTSMELAHKVVGFQHTAHIESQREGYRHWQSLWHRHHDERDCHHEVVEHDLCHIEVVLATPSRIGKNIMYEEDDEGCHRHHATHLGNYGSQLVKLHIERCLHRSLLGGFLRHLTYLCCIANGSHHKFATSVHHHRGAKDNVARISSIATAFRIFLCDRFARECGFIDLQVGTNEQLTISRHLIAHLDEHHVAHHDVMARYLHHLTASTHLHRLLLAQCRQHIKLLGGITLEIKSHGSGQEHSDKDADGLHKIMFDKSEDE